MPEARMRTGPIVLTVANGVGLLATFVAQHLYPGSSFTLIAWLFFLGQACAMGPLLGPFDRLMSYDSRGYKLLDKKLTDQLLEYVSELLYGVACIAAVWRLTSPGM
jgi:hypothetical protein